MGTKYGEGDTGQKATFDTDSGTCGIDNRASASMSPHKSDFQGELFEEKRVIRGFEGAKVYTIYKGTLLLPIEDDEGRIDQVEIPNSYYVPSCPYRIISPQHWAQEVQDSTEDGTGCITYSDRAILFWNGGTRKKTVQIDKQNVFTFVLPAGYERFHAMCATCSLDPFEDDDNPAVVNPSELICHLIHPERDREDPELIRTDQYFFPSNLAGLMNKHKSSPLKTVSVPPTASPTQKRAATTSTIQKRVTFDPSVRIQLKSTLRRHQQSQREAIQGASTVETVAEVEKDLGPPIQTVPTSEPVNMFDLNSNSEEADQVTEINLQPSTENDSAELLRIHHKFGHVPFQRLTSNGKTRHYSCQIRKMSSASLCFVFLRQSNQESQGKQDASVNIAPQESHTSGRSCFCGLSHVSNPRAYRTDSWRTHTPKVFTCNCVRGPLLRLKLSTFAEDTEW